MSSPASSRYNGSNDRICEGCGGPIPADRKASCRHCNDRCRVLAHKERKRRGIIARHLALLNEELKANGFDPVWINTGDSSDMGLLAHVLCHKPETI